MQEDHPLPNGENDDLTIINTLKLLNSSQKKGILDEIKLLKNMDDTAINPSSTAFPKDRKLN